LIVLRFKVRCRPEKTEEVRAALADVIDAARSTEGVVSFDIARDLSDENAFVATEVFVDEAARERQEALPQVATVMGLLPSSLAAPPEMTVFSAEPQPAGA
jgi:quinol monooxygenase YgiN